MDLAQQLHQLADDWLAEIRSGERHDDIEESVGSKVTDLSFSSPHKIQWAFLQIAANKAENEEEFGYVAAFVFEQLMSAYGDLYIDQVEMLATSNEKFRGIVRRSWRHMMSRRIWRRIQKIQGVEPDGLLQRLPRLFSRRVRW